MAFHKYLLLSILIILILSACSVVPTQLPMTPESVKTQTATALPLPSQTPSSTSATANENGLSESGPWLVYKNGLDEVFAINNDGSGKTEITILEKYNGILLGSLNSNYLAVYNKNTCTIFSFPDLVIQAQIDNFAYQHKHPDIPINKESDILNTPIWSPDGRYLAFSAVIDGPSSDLYTYDTATQQIIRISDGPNQIGNFEWSPDGKWIIYEEVSQFMGWVVEGFWLTVPYGKMNTLLYRPEDKNSQNILYWIDDQTFIAYSDSHAKGNVQLIDLQRGDTFLLIPGLLTSDPSYDPITKISAFGAARHLSDVEDDGKPYIYNPTDKSLKSVDTYANMFYWDRNINLFVTVVECDNEDEHGSYYAFSTDGELVCLDDTYEKIFHSYESPNEKLYVEVESLENDEVKLTLVDNDGLRLFNLIMDEDVSIGWRPDSKVIILNESNTMSLVDVNELNLSIITEDKGFKKQFYGSYYYDIAWIGEKND